MQDKITVYRPGEREAWEGLGYIGEMILTPIMVHWQTIVVVYIVVASICFIVMMLKTIAENDLTYVKNNGIGEQLGYSAFWFFFALVHVFKFIGIILGGKRGRY